MVGRRLAFVSVLSFFLFVITANATSINNCTHLNAADTYVLSADIDAVAAINVSDSCIQIETDNIILDLNDFTISTKNQSINMAIRIDDDLGNITIRDGTIQNFTKSDYGVGIYLAGGYNHGNSNLTISNVRLLSNNYGLFLNNATGAKISAAIDQPLSKQGVYAFLISNSTINLFTRAKTFGAVFDNMSFSIISGHFDTNVIIVENQTTILGSILNTISLGLIPPTIDTEIRTTQSKGIGLLCWNCSNNILRDISALGLIQGIDLTYYSTANTIATVDLPLSGVYTGGKFGGVYLGEDARRNKLCEIYGNIIDYCTAWRDTPFYMGTCPQKQNTVSDSCYNVFGSADYQEQASISQLFLTPLLPNITSSYYSFITYLTTPFFLVMFVCAVLSIFIGKATKNATFGLYALMFMVVILTAITFTTLWIGFIFVVVVGFILLKTANNKKDSVN